MGRKWLGSSVGHRPNRSQTPPPSPLSPVEALVATEYRQAGFTTVVQDNIFGKDIRLWLRAVPVRPRHLVVLRPSVDAVLERDQARQRETGKVAYRPGIQMPTS